MQVDIRKYFTPAAVASHLEALPELKTPIIDLVYSTRPTHPLPVLGIDELAGVVSNVPVVRRGHTVSHLGYTTIERIYHQRFCVE